ncbi:glutamine amidotransferase [Granulicoccus sp. GXG6511]|uniref:glutamine amidotransferase n=1 Tax=Granulicoccus sp. GXG6511 TaxID=3381351 RepID=UPI003D7D30C3
MSTSTGGGVPASRFLFLGTRAGHSIADAEYEAICHYAGLPTSRMDRVRLEEGPMPQIDLDRYAGVITGGSPFNSSDPITEKSVVQQRVEADMSKILDEIVARDMPFLGACYGVGTLGTHQGAVVDRTFGEPPGTGHIELTDAGRADPLCVGLPDKFDAFLGHKEAVRELPSHAVLLATSGPCPVQMFRVKKNLYATQFHPELDSTGLIERLQEYRHAGYFHPDELDRLTREALASEVVHPQQILKNFVEVYA